MLRIMWNGRSAMAAQQEKLDSISNNLANSNTEGYKRQEVNFKDLVYETLNRTGYPTTGRSDVPMQNGTGVRATDWNRDDRQGNMIATEQDTDLAIDGQGYFQVTTANNGLAYTRNGSFNINSLGKIVDKNGNNITVLDNNGRNINLNSNSTFRVSSDNFKVDRAGVVSIKVGNETQPIGTIPLYNAIGQNSMKAIGNNLLVPNEGVQTYRVATKDANIEQRFLESSNVDMASEMTDMIITQRAFELGSKALKTGDEMWGIANSLRGK